MASSTIGTAQDYTTITLWESNEQRDLVTATEFEEGQCLDEVFSEAVSISGWTTSSDYYPKLMPQAGTSFDGIAGNGPRVTHATSNCISVTNVDAWLYRMEVYDGGRGLRTIVGGAADASKIVKVESCIIRDTDSNSIEAYGDTTYKLTLWLWNSVIYDAATNSLDFADVDLTAVCENVTLYDPFYRGFYGTSNNITCYNCVVHRGGAASPNNCYTQCLGNYNADGLESGSDNTAPGAQSIHDLALSDIDWTNTTPGSEDFNIAATSDLVGAGTDRSGGTIGHSTDITGAARSAWDIGAFERVAAGGSPSPRAGISGPIVGPLGGPV